MVFSRATRLPPRRRGDLGGDGLAQRHNFAAPPTAINGLHCIAFAVAVVPRRNGVDGSPSLLLMEVLVDYAGGEEGMADDSNIFAPLPS